MSFSIVLYSISKRNNSTKQPSGSSRTLTGVLRDDCNIINPVVGVSFAGPYNQQLQRPVPMTSEFNPTSYNYAVIDEWNRSYFIDSWEWAGGLWWAHMSVDVLGTYKSEIEETEFYITRASADFDPDIIDNNYYSKINTVPFVLGKQISPNSNFTMNFDEGTVILQVLGADPSGNGGSFFLMSGGGLGPTMNSIYPIAQEDIGAALSKLINESVMGGTSTIMQNIVSIIWEPIKFSYLESISSQLSFVNTQLVLGQYPTGIFISKLTGFQNVSFEQQFTVDHREFENDGGERGQWLNISPFAEYYLYVPLIGNLTLDSTKVVSHEYRMSIKYEINLLNGMMTAKVYYGLNSNQPDSILHGVYNTNISIFIKSGGTTFDIATYASGTMQSLAAGEQAAAAGGPVLGAAVTAAGVVGAFSKSLGTASAGSSSNTLLPTILDNIEVKTVLYDPIDENNEEWGRPLCKRQTPAATGNGFILCAEGDIEIVGATQGELSQIKSYLEQGFYYE